jgi:hypothetical protein
MGVAWASVGGTFTGAIVSGVLARSKAPIPHHWVGLMRAPIFGAASAAAVILSPPMAPLAAIAIGTAVVLGNTAILYVTGDPAVRRIAREVRARVFPRPTPSA